MVTRAEVCTETDQLWKKDSLPKQKPSQSRTRPHETMSRLPQRPILFLPCRTV